MQLDIAGGCRREYGFSDPWPANIRALTMRPRQLITYYLWYFADVAAYLLKKEVEKIRLQVLFRLQVHIVRDNK